MHSQLQRGAEGVASGGIGTRTRGQLRTRSPDRVYAVAMPRRDAGDARRRRPGSPGRRRAGAHRDTLLDSLRGAENARQSAAPGSARRETIPAGSPTTRPDPPVPDTPAHNARTAARADCPARRDTPSARPPCVPLAVPFDHADNPAALPEHVHFRCCLPRLTAARFAPTNFAAPPLDTDPRSLAATVPAPSPSVSESPRSRPAAEAVRPIPPRSSASPH